MSLEINVTENNESILIAVSGEIDLYTSPELRSAILKSLKSKNDLSLDLANVAYMDSSGVATLVEAMQSSAKNGSSFVLVSPSNAVMKVLQLARLDSVFNIQESK